MTTLSSLAHSFFTPYKPFNIAPSAYLAQAGAATDGQKSSQTLGSAADLTSDVVSLSQAGIALSQRVDDLSRAAVSVAQQFLSHFAQQVLGGNSEGLKISFDSAVVSASSQYAGLVQHSSSASGSSDVAGFSLQDRSDFVGKGTITTADGQQYQFEVEVHFQASLQSVAASRTSNTADPASETKPQQAQNGDDRPLKLNFPGNASELGHLFHRGPINVHFELPALDDGNGKPRHGNLLLRLLDNPSKDPLNGVAIAASQVAEV